MSPQKQMPQRILLNQRRQETMPAIKSPYPIGYSSDFEKDDPKNAETLLALWKAWDNGDLAAAKDMFADSVELYFLMVPVCIPPGTV